MKIRKIKTVVTSKEGKEFKKALTLFIFEGGSIMKIARDFKVDYEKLRVYVKGRGLKNLEYKGVKYRRCNLCGIHKVLNNFNTCCRGLYTECINCYNLNKRNKYRIIKNTSFLKKSKEQIEKMNKKTKRYRDKYKDRITLKRRVKRIVERILKKD